MYPNRISVPFLIVPAKSFNTKIFKHFEESKQKLPSTYVLSEILKIIYDTEFKHPEFSIKEINWLSSVYSYPKRDVIFTTGYDSLSQQYICSKILTRDLKNLKITSNKDIKINFFVLKGKNLLPIDTNKKNFFRLKESFLTYLTLCREDESYPILQKNL